MSRRAWLGARFMMWSYAGLLMVRSWTSFVIAVGIATTLVAIMSAYYIERAACPLEKQAFSEKIS